MLLKKLKTVLSIKIENHDFQNSIEIYTFLGDQDINIWEDIKNLLRFFLSNYTYIKISSNRAFHRVRPLGDKYYTPDKVYVYYVSKLDKIENFIDIGASILKITQEYRFPNFLAKKKTIRKLRNKVFCSNQLKIKIKERLRILINFAKMQRDLNSLIINTAIYLERVSVSYLELKRKLKKWELDILFKNRGLSHFVESQLPCFIKEKEYLNLVPAAIEIVKKRNEIIHLGVVFAYDESMVKKCDDVLRLISYMEDSRKNENHKKQEYYFDFNFLGIVDIEDQTIMDIITVIIPYSKTEFEYYNANRLTLIKNFEIKLTEYAEFEIKSIYKPFSRVYFSKNNFIIILALFPTRISTNLKILRILIQEIASKIEPDKINFKFLYKGIPPGTFKLLKEALKLEIEGYKEMLKYNSYNIEYIKVNTNN